MPFHCKSQRWDSKRDIKPQSWVNITTNLNNHEAGALCSSRSIFRWMELKMDQCREHSPSIYYEIVRYRKSTGFFYLFQPRPSFFSVACNFDPGPIIRRSMVVRCCYCFFLRLLCYFFFFFVFAFFSDTKNRNKCDLLFVHRKSVACQSAPETALIGFFDGMNMEMTGDNFVSAGSWFWLLGIILQFVHLEDRQLQNLWKRTHYLFLG